MAVSSVAIKPRDQLGHLSSKSESAVVGQSSQTSGSSPPLTVVESQTFDFWMLQLLNTTEVSFETLVKFCSLFSQCNLNLKYESCQIRKLSCHIRTPTGPTED